MAKTEPIALGIVGLGRAGRGMHCPELKGKEKKFQIVAVCDVIKARREGMVAEYGCKSYSKIEALVADPAVEMVDIATRSVNHFEHAKLALRAGKHVFLEKPMCVSYEEASKLKSLAKKSDGELYVRHNRRFEPAFNHIREIFARGILGDVYEIKLRRLGYQRRNDWQTLKRYGGGQLLNWGPHIIDHGLRLLESPVKDVSSYLKRIAAVGDAEDHLKIILTGSNGRIVDLEISGGVAIGEPEYLIFGSRGSLRCSGNTIELRYLDPRRKLAECKPDPKTPEGGGFGNPEKLHWIEKTIPVKPKKKVSMSDIWDALFDTVRKGKPFPISLDEAVSVMKVVSQAKKGTPFNTPKKKR